MRRSTCRALSPATGIVLTAPRSAPSGTTPSRVAGTARSSAQPASPPSVTTGVPAAGPDPSAAARTTTPAASQPIMAPSGVSGLVAPLTSP